MSDPISTILIIDDQAVARETIRGLLSREPYTLHFATNGVDGLAQALARQPDVVLSDVMMPGMDGFEVCRRLRDTPGLAEVPVLLVTSLDDRDSRLQGLRAGADDFITKPYDSLELLTRLQSLTRLNRFRRLMEERHHVETLNSELLKAYDKTIEGWVHALDLRDHETEGHTQRVTEMTVWFAQMTGITDAQTLKQIWRGALLHDIGKLGVPDAILLKPAKLTAQEWTIMRQHPVYAYEWLSPIEYLVPALEIPYCHHERWDGTGYPHRLAGQAIPLAARLFTVVDVWDALISDRPYRAALPTEQVAAHIRAGSGTHFDPAIVETFLRMIKLQN